eukprot:1161429-Pelagomonas_calceolata.AAC.7
MQAVGSLPASIKEKETHWLRRAVSPLHHKAAKQKMPMGIWRVARSSWLQNLTVRNIFVFNSTPNGNKLVGIHHVMITEWA